MGRLTRRLAAGPATWFGAGLTAAAGCLVMYTLLLGPPAVARVELPPRAAASPGPAAGAPPPAAPPPRQAPAPPVATLAEAACPPGAGSSRVNLNTASAADLQALPGIGPAAAQRIVEERQRDPFTTVDQLHDRHIVSALTLGRIRDLAVVE